MKAKANHAKKPPVVAEPPKLRDPTLEEMQAIEVAKRSQAERPNRAAVNLKADAEGAMTISNPHVEHKGWSTHLTETFATSSEAFANQSFVRVLGAVSDRKTPVTELQANAALALMAGIAPANELEAAIGEQIIAAHMASLDFLQRARLNAGEYVSTAAAYAGMATKLSRTMAAHIESLTKLRSGGRQRIEVVYVNGPAIIGDNAQTVFTGVPREGGESAILVQPHGPAPLAHIAAAKGLPMRREDPKGDAVSVTGGEGAEALSDARRK
jgi:hypothetical protein